MGLFSRRDKTQKSASAAAKPSLSTSQSNASLRSGHSSLQSPHAASNLQILNRTSGIGTTSGPGTPLTPFSPTRNMSRADFPKPPDPQLDPVGYLRSLASVRERCAIVSEKALRNELRHFDVDMSKFGDVVTFVANIIKVRSFF